MIKLGDKVTAKITGKVTRTEQYENGEVFVTIKDENGYSFAVVKEDMIEVDA